MITVMIIAGKIELALLLGLVTVVMIVTKIEKVDRMLESIPQVYMDILFFVVIGGGVVMTCKGLLIFYGC